MLNEVHFERYCKEFNLTQAIFTAAEFIEFSFFNSLSLSLYHFCPATLEPCKEPVNAESLLKNWTSGPESLGSYEAVAHKCKFHEANISLLQF